MFNHYVLVSLRFLKKNKRFTWINVIGLSTGLASCLLILNFIHHELSFDRFHADADRIYRVNSDLVNTNGDKMSFVNTPPALTPGARGVIPEIEKITQLRYAMRCLLRKGHHVFYENRGFYADSSFLDVFGFKLTAGSRSAALDAPNAIVLTEPLARKYFVDQNPIGQTITLNNSRELEVTGVLESVPANSHIQFNFLISFLTYEIPAGVIANLSSWRWLGFLTYIKLRPDAMPKDTENKLTRLFIERTPDGQTAHEPHLQALPAIYFGSRGLLDDLASPLKTGNAFTVYALGIIALMILVIASFNFMNLTLATSVNRSRDIGLRKMLGANQRGLILYMLSESVLISLIGLAGAYGLVFFAFPYLKEALDWDFALQWPLVIYSLPAAFLVACLLGVVAGFHPAASISGIKTVTAYRGTKKFAVSRRSKTQTVLITLQFALSIALITATLVITQQIRHLRDWDLGFDQENVIEMKLLPNDMARYYDAFKHSLLQNSGVVSVSKSGRRMGEPWPANPIRLDGQDWSQAKQIAGNWVDYDYLRTMGLQIKSGRPFSRYFASDSLQGIILNETAVAMLGLDDPIGQRVDFFSSHGPRTIVGVVRDFNHASLHSDIEPVALIMPFMNLENMFVRITPGDVAAKIAAIRSTWESIAPGIPLDMHFMDDQLDLLYQKEQKLSVLIRGFSVLAVILACLGLYGLVSFMVNNRMKEVGVRKVLGATVPSLMYMFSHQYMALIGAAALLAAPGMYIILNRWLNTFASRIQISWWIFVLSGLIALAIALLTMSLQTVRAATANPVENLRDE
jgi:putative ABC transport system permease protein